MNNAILSASALALLCAAATTSAQITIPMVTVGNPGNPGDTRGTDTADGHVGQYDLGAVGVAFSIGKYDVTVSQYTAFLNAVAQTDTYGLYNSNMASDLTSAGITRSGSNGSYSYFVIPGKGNHPVTYVSWYDAARFCNWMSNGQPTGLGEVPGSTEAGSYNLMGNAGFPTYNGTGLYRIPTQSEWYKAAYYDPGIGGANNYWQFATRTNTVPGNIVGSGANMANYYYYNGSTYILSVTQSASYRTSQNYLTDVGAFMGSPSTYGTYDQSGDAHNWNDSVLGGASRGVRGGSWDSFSSDLSASSQGYNTPTYESAGIGFRMASEITPEPTALSLIFAGGLLLSRRKRPSV